MYQLWPSELHWGPTRRAGLWQSPLNLVPCKAELPGNKFPPCFSSGKRLHRRIDRRFQNLWVTRATSKVIVEQWDSGQPIWAFKSTGTTSSHEGCVSGVRPSFLALILWTQASEERPAGTRRVAKTGRVRSQAVVWSRFDVSTCASSSCEICYWQVLIRVPFTIIAILVVCWGPWDAFWRLSVLRVIVSHCQKSHDPIACATIKKCSRFAHQPAWCWSVVLQPAMHRTQRMSTCRRCLTAFVCSTTFPAFIQNSSAKFWFASI